MSKGLLISATVLGVLFTAFTILAVINQHQAEGVEGFSDIEFWHDHPQFEAAVRQDPDQYRIVQYARIEDGFGMENVGGRYMQDAEDQMKVIVGGVHLERGLVDEYNPEKVIEILTMFLDVRERRGITHITQFHWDYAKVDEALDLLEKMEAEGFNVRPVRRFIIEHRPREGGRI